MSAPERASWQNPRILATLLLIFLAGAVTGAISMRVHDKGHRGASTGFWKDDYSLLSYEKLKRDLDLTPDQAVQLKTILDDFVKYHEHLEEQIDDWRATGKNRIFNILNPQQKQRFQKVCNEIENR
jgi:hypothetical protein